MSIRLSRLLHRRSYFPVTNCDSRNSTRSVSAAVTDPMARESGEYGRRRGWSAAEVCLRFEKCDLNCVDTDCLGERQRASRVRQRNVGSRTKSGRFRVLPVQSADRCCGAALPGWITRKLLTSGSLGTLLASRM